MDAEELRRLLEAHSEVLAGRGMEVSAVSVEPPATIAQVDEVEKELGVVLPPSFRFALLTLSRSVSWSWHSSGEFQPPFEQIFAGELSWSLDSLVDLQEEWRGWVDTCFPDPSDWYDEVWHGKVAFAGVGNGDQLAVDLAPHQLGAVVYLSHDDGLGHGYVMASSLLDLVDRWVPLACPGSEDWQWLPFVPWDKGPIDPACSNGQAWIEHLGLQTDTLRTESIPPTQEHVDALFATYRNDPTTNLGMMAGLRAIKCCSVDRAEDVIAMFGSESSRIQETAAGVIGDWGYEPGAHALGELGRSGSHNGRSAALRALARMEGPEAAAVRDQLRGELDEHWATFLDW